MSSTGLRWKGTLCRKNLTRLATEVLYPGRDHRVPARSQNVAGTSTGGGRAAVKLWPGGDQRVVSAVVTQYRFFRELKGLYFLCQ